MFLPWLGYTEQQSDCNITPRTALCDLKLILSKQNKRFCCRLISKLLCCKHTSGKKLQKAWKSQKSCPQGQPVRKQNLQPYNLEMNSASNLGERQCSRCSCKPLCVTWPDLGPVPKRMGYTQTLNPHNCVLFQTTAFVIHHTAAKNKHTPTQATYPKKSWHSSLLPPSIHINYISVDGQRGTNLPGAGPRADHENTVHTFTTYCWCTSYRGSWVQPHYKLPHGFRQLLQSTSCSFNTMLTYKLKYVTSFNFQKIHNGPKFIKSN